MAVYYKFKSAKDYDTIPIDGHFISVGNLKEKIIESKHLGRGTDLDLVVTNAQSSQEYSDEFTLIPKNTAVLVRRVPGKPRMPIVATRVTEAEPTVENKVEDVQGVKNSFIESDSTPIKFPEDTEWDEFGNDLYSIPEALPVQSSNQVQDAPLPNKADEDSKIKALIDTPALDWQRQPAEGFGPGRGFGRNARIMNNRNFGFERKTPPPGYVCHRCKVPGHFIQHCPTNGDPNFDIKKVKPPTGIPKSMLMPTLDGSYALPSGAAAVLKPNEAAFEKEIEGLPSTRSVGDLPPELRCPLCKEVMKDAVLTSKCCFNSFCDRCIRDNIISKYMCVCGATNILADDLLPNKTLRDTINRILESNTRSTENGGSGYQVQDMESRNPQAKIPSPSQSAASKVVQDSPAPPHREENSRNETVGEGQNVNAPTWATEKEKAIKVAGASEVISEPINVKEPASQGSTPLADEEVQLKPAVVEAGKKKKKKRTCVPLNAAEMQWRMAQHLAAESYMISMGPAAYNPYWGVHPGIEGFVPPYSSGMTYTGYGVAPLDVFGGFLPQDPFGGQRFMLPFGPPRRDPADFGRGSNAGPPPMSREEFEARKADLKRRKEIERRDGKRDMSKDGEFQRELSSRGDVSSMRSKSKSIPGGSSSNHHHQHSHRPERLSPDHQSEDTQLPRPSSKRKSDYDDYHHHHHHHRCDHQHQDHHNDNHRHDYDDGYNRSSRRHRSGSSSAVKPSAVLSEPPEAADKAPSAADKKQKSSVFSLVNLAEREAAASKKRKLSSSGEAPASFSLSHKGLSNGHYEDHKRISKRSAAVDVDYESSDDDRHFKRRPSRYEASPPAVAPEWEEEQPRHARRSKERNYHYSKHR